MSRVGKWKRCKRNDGSIWFERDCGSYESMTIAVEVDEQTGKTVYEAYGGYQITHECATLDEAKTRCLQDAIQNVKEFRDEAITTLAELEKLTVESDSPRSGRNDAL